MAVSDAAPEICHVPTCLICILFLIAGLLVHSACCLCVLPPGTLLLLLALAGAFSIALLWQNIPHPGRSCWQETLGSSGRGVCPLGAGAQEIPAASGCEGGIGAELEGQHRRQGLWQGCQQCLGCNSPGRGAAAPQKGVSSLEVGLGPAPQSSPLGSSPGLAFSQKLKHAGGSGHEETNG